MPSTCLPLEALLLLLLLLLCIYVNTFIRYIKYVDKYQTMVLGQDTQPAASGRRSLLLLLEDKRTCIGVEVKGITVVCYVKVKPILARLKTTLAGSTAALVVSGGLLVGLVQAGTDGDGIYGKGHLFCGQLCLLDLHDVVLCQCAAFPCCSGDYVLCGHCDCIWA